MKKFTALLLCLALVFSLAACGSDTGAPKDQPADTPVNTPADTAPDIPEDTAPVDDVPVDKPEDEPDVVAPVDTGVMDKANAAIADLEAKYVGLTTDSLTWDYDAGTKTLTISGEGPMLDYGYDTPEWGAYSMEAETLVIGDGVTSIGDSAFYAFRALTNVKLGSSVEFLGYSAFYYCPSLQTINFPASLKYIGGFAFSNALLHSDVGFTLPEGLLYIGEGAFFSAFKESFVSIPASTVSIAYDAFCNIYIEEFRVDAANPAYTAVDGVLFDKAITTLIAYPALKTDKTYTVPGTVTTIKAESIQVSDWLETLVIPASVTSIEESAIYWDYALTSIDVDAANPSYKSVDGVLFTKDGRTLIAYPCANARTEYEVPAGCERLGMYSISTADNLTKLELNDGLKEIGQYALFGNHTLKEIELPGSLQIIEPAAFRSCGALVEIDYDGTSADWQAIDIMPYNDVLTNGSVIIDFED